MNTPIFSYGHFYSPIVDTAELTLHPRNVWQARTHIPGVDLNASGHLEILGEWFPKYIKEYLYPDSGDANSPNTFFNLNDQFSWLDARALFVFLRHLRPKRLIEVGSGFSSLMIADVNTKYFNQSMDFTCIEPFPRQFLIEGVPGVSKLITQLVQDVPLHVFDELAAGDILFIDSSHVAKTGSDVLYLFFEVLPRLAPGVHVHIHDVFLPSEYPKDWVIAQNRSWNEQYLLQALLMDSKRYHVMFGSAYAALCHGLEVVKALARADGHGMSGGSFWIEVVGEKADSLTAL